MPLLNVSASTANLVYHASLIVLMVGAALVILSAIALVWSNTIREQAADERLSSFNDVSARANAEVLKAKAEVATANRQVVEANAAAVNARKEIADAKLQGGAMRPVVSGRQITVENCGLFINFVKTVAKGRVVVEAISSNPEAAQFAKQVSAMLTSAGYDVTENFGSTTLLGEQPVGVQMKIRSMAEQPLYAGSLQKGLEFIGVDTSGALDPSAGDSVIIFIGSKP